MAFLTVALFRAAPMLALAALAACGTPQEQCINQNTRDLSVLDRLIAKIKGQPCAGLCHRSRRDNRNRMDPLRTFLHRDPARRHDPPSPRAALS